MKRGKPSRSRPARASRCPRCGSRERGRDEEATEPVTFCLGCGHEFEPYMDTERRGELAAEIRGAR